MLDRCTARPGRPLLTLLAVLATCALTACGGGSDGGGKAADAAAAKPARPDLRPPKLRIRTSQDGQAEGLVFVAPKVVFGAVRKAGAQAGPEIVDAKGHTRWFLPNQGKDVAYDFRTQTYEGKPVLTYWSGRPIGGSGRGRCMVRDQSYKLIAAVDFKGPHDADIHECRLTASGTMLMSGYETVEGDTSALEGGKVDDKITEGVVKEIDVKTGKVLLQWRSLEGGVPISESYEDLEGHSGPGYDYFHLNSIAVDPTDGNIVISARHTWAEYKIDRDTGALLWKLGGKDSDFAMGDGAQTAWQHDAVPTADGEIRTFDNAKGTTGGKVTYPYSRITWVKADPATGQATLVKSLKHPRDVQGGTQGSAQELPGGGTFVGWGSAGVSSEFDADGKLIWDAKLPQSYDSYRSYKDPWVGKPTTKPDVSAVRTGDGVVVHASWNGSTAVQRWQVLAADDGGGLSPVGEPFAWTNLDSKTTVDTDAERVVVRALDQDGQPLGDSEAVAVSDPS